MSAAFEPDFTRTRAALVTFDAEADAGGWSPGAVTPSLIALAEAFYEDTAAYNHRDTVVPFILSGYGVIWLRERRAHGTLGHSVSPRPSSHGAQLGLDFAAVSL